jgi:hypothetical protein
MQNLSLTVKQQTATGGGGGGKEAAVKIEPC